MKYYWVFALTFYLFSCDIEKKPDHIVLEHYEDGSVKRFYEVITADNDTTEFVLFSNGDTMLISSIKFGMKNGECLAFWENKDTASILEYKDGKLDGMQRWYDRGALSYYGRYRSDIPIDEHLLYGLNDEPVEYRYYDEQGHLRYHVFYDEEGEFMQDTGFAIFYNEIYRNNKILDQFDTITNRDTLKYEISIPNTNLVDKVDYTLSLAVKDSQGALLDSMLITPVNNNNLSLTGDYLVPISNGRVTISFLLQRTVIVSNQIKIYRGYIELNVVPNE